MYELAKSITIEASHQLVHHDGKCKNLHGHTWRIEVVVRGDTLTLDGPKKGMLLDLTLLGEFTRTLHDVLDHQHLNDVLDTDAPTSEYLARWVWERFYAWAFPEPCYGFQHAVVVHETATSSCRYQRNG